MNTSQNVQTQIRNKILGQKKKGLLSKFLKNLPKGNRIQVSLICPELYGQITIPVRSELCTNPACIFDLESLLARLKMNQNIPFECSKCKTIIQLDKLFVDEDTQAAITEIKKRSNQIYDMIIRDPNYARLMVNKQNEWVLEDQNNRVFFVVKQGEQYDEYSDEYPTHQSNQTPEFYKNGWLFIHENLDNLQNKKDKLQGHLHLFFPSIKEQNKRWKDIYILTGKDELAFFNKSMSLCKVFWEDTHMVFASGGLKNDDPRDFDNKTFIVPIFSSDPDAEIGNNQIVKIKDCLPMKSLRGFHQLIQLDNYVYALGGDRVNHDPSTHEKFITLKSCERYDLSTKKWELISDFAKNRQLFGVLANQTNIFVIGGRVFNQHTKRYDEETSIEIYNPKVDQWTVYHIPIQDHVSRPVFALRPYAFFGKDNNIIVFGAIKEQLFDINKQDSNLIHLQSNQCVSISLDEGQVTRYAVKLPDRGLELFKQCDMQGIYYNQRFIFAWKQFEDKNEKFYYTPSIFKYDHSSGQFGQFTGEYGATVSY